MVIDWRKQIDECIKNTELMPIFHGSSVEKRLQIILVVKKLHELEYSNQKIFNWLQLAGCESVFCVEEVEELIEVAKKRRWPKTHEFKVFITKSEIDYIDAIKTTKENKSFLLGTIAFAKMMNIKKKKPTFNIRDRSYVYYIATGNDGYNVGEQRARYISDFIHRLAKNKDIVVTNATTTIKIYTGRQGGMNKKLLNNIIQAKWVDWESKDGYCIQTLEKDVKRLCDLAFHDPTRTCSLCGKEFVVSNKTKREICDDCYKKARKKDRHVVSGRSHHKKGPPGNTKNLNNDNRTKINK